MQNVPKVVRERLKAAAPVVSRPDADSSAHPDADLLTAFAERALTEFERAAVLEHLSRCGDCREVLALALPASEEILVTGVRTSSRGWLSWPTLRWGFVTAGIVAIASVGVLRYRRPPASVALKQSPGLEVAANEPKKQELDRFVAQSTKEKERVQAAAAPAFADALSASSSATDAKKSAPRAEAPPLGVLSPQIKSGTNGYHGGAFAANTLPHGPRLANQSQIQNNVQNQAPVAAPPSAYSGQAATGDVSANTGAPAASDTVEVASAAPAISTEAQSLDAAQGRDLSTVGRAKAPVSSAPPVASVPSAAPVPSNSSASGAAGATINRHSQPSAVGEVSAQAAPGKMEGYVFDPSGAVLPNARITVTSSNPGRAKTAVTNSQGAWLIAGLPSGNYKAQAEAPGFQTAVLDLNYDANQPSMYRFTLNVGSAAETVEVASANAQVQTESASIGGPINGRNLSQLSTVVPRWTISATGRLQRSFDQGKTWQVVDVNANPAYFFNADSSATSLQIADKASRAKVPKNKDSGKVAKQEAGALTFRAVAATGSEVWAGGNGGALYHSADGGNHWNRIMPASTGTTLTGDIISLDFPDRQHGKVSTSTSEVWTTADGGQTWLKE